MDPRCTGIERELNEQLRDVSLCSDGVLSAAALTDLGFTKGMIQTRREAGRLIPILKGSYALPGTRLTHRGRCRAAVESARREAVVSHGSALALHGLIRDPGVVHLTGKGGAFRSSDSKRWISQSFGFRVIRHETRFLPEEHVTELNGIRVTTVERALRDFAATASPAELMKALTQGEKERSLCWGTLRELTATSAGHKGNGLLIAEIKEWDPAFADTSSDPEIEFLLMIRGEKMPMPAVNVRIGSYVVDFYWEHLRLVVELDPYGTHSGKESYRRDHRKSIELEAMGLRVVRFTWEDEYRHEQRTASELWTIIRQQAELLRCPVFPTPGYPAAEVPQV
jgi:very-short-patch-repair endonuclease